MCLFMLSQRVYWSRKQQHTQVFLPGEFQGQRSLVGYNPWGLKESDTTEYLSSSSKFIAFFAQTAIQQLKTWVLKKNLWILLQFMSMMIGCSCCCVTCASLQTLLRHYRSDVKKKIYESLPKRMEQKMFIYKALSANICVVYGRVCVYIQTHMHAHNMHRSPYLKSTQVLSDWQHKETTGKCKFKMLPTF